MATDGRRRRPLDNISNFRDVGAASPALVRPGRLYRSARPDAATAADVDALKNTHHIKTIIDLRTPSEHVETARKLQSEDIPAVPVVNPDYPLALPGFEYNHVNLNGSAYTTALVRQLSYYQAARLCGLYLFGYRREAIAVVAENVMAQRGLKGLAEDTLVNSTVQVKQLFDVLADPDAAPVLLHCTQGKDRTGLAVLLVLLLLGVDEDAIDRDYRLTDVELAPERPEKLAELAAFGFPPEFADCAEGWTAHVTSFIRNRYGGVEDYLESCGVSAEQREAVKKNFQA